MDDGIVYVGKKPIGNYVQAIITQLSIKDEVKVMAKRMNTITAFESAEVIKRKFGNLVSVEANLGIEEELSYDKKIKRNFSVITITIKKVK